MQLNELYNNWGARKTRKRVGRGIGSGLGKTSGKGHKGQSARSGVAFRGFEGGQMPLQRRLPKRGFNQPNRIQYAILNLCDLQNAVDSGKLNTATEITVETLKNAGILRRSLPLRILAKGTITAPIKISAAYVTAATRAAIENAKGTVTISESSASNNA